MKAARNTLSVAVAIASLALGSSPLLASSHMDAPLITLDDAANTTDVYAFRSESNGTQYLTTALAVYPFEEPGIGPNKYNFDDNVLYQIHIALGEDVAAGRATLSYQFLFETTFKNENTILQSFLGVLNGDDMDGDGFDDNQNLRQTYTVTKVDRQNNDNDEDDEDDDERRTVLGAGRVPPNNQGLVTPKYNQDDNGEKSAKEGVASEAALDDYTRQAIADLDGGHRVFAGQRDDGFYADIQSIFDLDFTFGGTNKPFDSQGGFNVHTIVLQIPLSELGGPMQVVGVFATTSRREETELSKEPEEEDDEIEGDFIQVGRQGNPLFNEALVAIVDKDLYNRTEPTRDNDLFRQYAESAELSTVLRLSPTPAIIREIFIPDLIKVDLSTGPVRLAGNPDDVEFHRLSVFGGDTLMSMLTGGVVAGGWPNGRRFGDDVVDIALIALGVPVALDPGIDRVKQNDITFNKVMPYAATPLNGRNHGHH